MKASFRTAGTLVLVDNHAIVRHGLATFCESLSDLQIVGQSSDEETGCRMILELKPDFAVIGLNLPLPDGGELISRLRAAGSTTGIIILSINRDHKLISELFRQGADAYLLKEGPAWQLFEAMAHISGGSRYLTPLLRDGGGAAGIESENPVERLSGRELQVFEFLLDGVRPRDIAKTLSISPKTVDAYRANIFRKLRVDGLASLVRLGFGRHLSENRP